MIIETKVPDSYEGYRLDLFLLESLSDDLSRSTIQSWIRQGGVRREGIPILKSGYKVSEGETFEITSIAKPKINLEPVKMDIPVLYEEEDFWIVHKPPGIATHPGPGDRSITLVNGLLHQFSQLSSQSGSTRPGIVHRLDKPTEGVLIVARNDRAHAYLSKLFMERKMNKVYYAWVLQTPPETEGTIDQPIGRHPKERLKMMVRPDGRRAITHYKTIAVINSKKGRKFSLLEIHLETGRTHQIRVHLLSIGCPIVGDLLYSRSGMEYKKYGLMLISKSIQFTHPKDQHDVLAQIEFPKRYTDFEKNCVNL